MHKYYRYAFMTGLIVSLIKTGQAAGYLVQENNIFHGQAFAGRAVICDASSLFWNIATSGFLAKNEMAVYGSYLYPKIKFKVEEGTSSSIRNSLVTKGSKSTFIPALYAVYRLNNRTKLGIAVTAPFGLTIDNGNKWVGRYITTKTHLQTLNINPSLSYKVNEKLVVAAGIVSQHIYADLRCAFNQMPVRSDGLIKLSGKDWGYGYNLGLMFKLTEDTQVGLAYRSAIRHTLKGKVRTENILPRVALAKPQLTNGSIETNLKTPSIISLSLSQQLNNKWTLLTDITYTQWKVFKTLSINQTSANIQSAFVEPQYWKNTYMYSLGFNYKCNDQWLLRGGSAYEKTPTNNQYRSPRLLDADRWWLAGGIDYLFNDHSVIRFGYTHIFAKKEKLNIKKSGMINSTTLKGSFKGKVNIIGLQFNYNF